MPGDGPVQQLHLRRVENAATHVVVQGKHDGCPLADGEDGLGHHRGNGTLDARAIDNEEVLKRVEDRLIVAIKEILWEVVPPLAEKIIKEEIETIKAEVSKSFK